MKKIFYFITLLLISCLLTNCAMVDSAEVGIKFKKFSVTSQGQLDATPCSGVILYNPFTTSVYTYPVYIQRVDYKPFIVMTSDAAEFKMDPILAYRVNRDEACNIFAKYRVSLDNIEVGYIRTAVYDAYRITANKYKSEELMSSRAKFENEVKIMLDESLRREGFIVEEFTSQIIPPVSLSQAIEAKNRAIQESLKAQNEVKKAQAEAEIRIAKAKGTAEALKIEADGEAYYNRTIANSLNPLLIQQDLIEKWDGKLPQYTSGNNGLNLLNIK